jgi:hypothetical protein
MIEYRNVIPVVLKAPFFTQISSTFVKISMQTQDKAIIYGIILLQSNSTINPNSFQISQGFDIYNKPLKVYHKDSCTTDSTGFCSLDFSDLDDGVNYKVYITIGNDLPYIPKLLLDDD